MIKPKIQLLLLSALCARLSFAQAPADTAAQRFSLNEAIEYALKHNATYMNVENDAKLNTYKKNEIAGAWLPQISGVVDGRDNLKLPTSLLPGSFGALLGLPTDKPIPTQFGVRYNITATGSVNQIIFNSDIFVGIQAAKAVVALSQKNIQRSKVETAQNVAKAYYGVLIAKARIKLLDLSIDRLQTLKDNTTAMFSNGFAEKIDADRLEVSYNNMVTQKQQTLQLISISELTLKFQMGYDMQKNITLTDSLSKLERQEEMAAANADKIDISVRPEYQVLQAQEKLNQYDLKRYRYQYLPSLSAYGVAAEQFQKKTLDFKEVPGGKNWYPFAYFGLTLNVPVFDGLQKNARIQQAKINLLKTQNSFTQLQQSMQLEVAAAQTTYRNAQISMQTQKRNIDLAKNVYEVSKKKYEQGIGSSLELSTSQNDLQTAETNYFNSLYDLVIAQIDFQKATATLVK